MNLVLTGGGTAGHTIPHLALLPALKRHFENICYIGTDGIEKQIIANTGIEFYQIKCPKFIRSVNLKNLSIPASLISSVVAAKKILKKLSPDAVFSKGGYVALPVVLAARLLKIPVIAHESDLSAGLANRLSARFCNTVFTSFYQTSLTIANGAYSGPPVREGLFLANKVQAKKTYGFSGRKKTVLVLGGGSGSKALNQCIRQNLEALTKEFNFINICGKGNLSGKECPGYKEYEFIADMENAYAACDIVLSRAGSNTVFEVLLLRKPAVFVPLPKARSRGDQIENARYFESRGMCKMLFQETLSLPSLLYALKDAAGDRDLKDKLADGRVKCGNYILVNAIVNAAANKGAKMGGSQKSLA